MGERAVPYDFFLCQKCHRLCTAVEVAQTLGLNPPRRSPCACGGLKVSPTNLPWWGWLLPRVWTFAVARLRGVA